jgi:hypothetical protein
MKKSEPLVVVEPFPRDSCVQGWSFFIKENLKNFIGGFPVQI